MIDRPLYLNKLMSWKDKDTIKVITGIRRCGKSKILESFAEKLKAQGVTDKQIIQINFEEMGDEQITDAKTLHDKIDKILKANKEKMHENLYNSLMLVTALNPYIGYENAAKCAHKAFEENISLKEACVGLGFLTKERFDEVFHPEEMI